MTLPRAVLGAWLALGLVWASARAEWPYLTEEAFTLGEWRYSLSLGVSVTDHQSRDLRGGKGSLWRIPEVEGTLGVGSRAEVSFQYDYLWFDADEGGSTHDSGDLRLWTKLVLFPGRAQDLSLRFGVKLPNTSDDEDLGTDETDFFASALYDLRLGSALISLNAGLGILGDPERNSSQDDVFTWAGAARLALGQGFSTGIDASGYSGPFGVNRRRDFATFAGVFTWHRGRWRVDLAARRGILDAQAWGLVAGVTYESEEAGAWRGGSRPPK